MSLWVHCGLVGGRCLWTAALSQFKSGSALEILFVCTGNICRSPTAERLAVDYAARTKLFNFAAASAGTRAVIARPIHPSAAEVLEELGGQSSNFAARQLTARIASNADLVLAMTAAHRDSVLELAPRLLHRTFMLTEASRLVSEHGARTVADLAVLRPQLATRELTDISDPIGQTSEVFRHVGTQIAELIPPVVELCRRAATLGDD